MALNDIDSAVESFSKALILEPNDGEHRDIISFTFFLFYTVFHGLSCAVIKLALMSAYFALLVGKLRNLPLLQFLPILNLVIET